MKLEPVGATPAAFPTIGKAAKSVAPRVSASSTILEVELPQEGGRCCAGGCFSKFWNCILIAIKMRPRPTQDSPIDDDAVYPQLDECLEDLASFKSLLEKTCFVHPHYHPCVDQTSVFFLLCGCEGLMLKIPNRGYFEITPSIVKYVYRKSPVFLETADRLQRTIFSYIRSKETLKYLLAKEPALATVKDRGRTALYLYATFQEQPVRIRKQEVILSLEERYKIVGYLLSKEDLNARDEFGNSILHHCPDKIIAECILGKKPEIIFSVNNRYEMPFVFNAKLKGYLTHFASEHRDLYPTDPTELLQIMIGRALNQASTEGLEQAIALIEKGADLSANVSLLGKEKPIFFHIIQQSINPSWAALLDVAIEKATEELIKTALNYIITFILKYGSEEHWLEAARKLIEKFPASYEEVEVQGKRIKEWDNLKKWNLDSQLDSNDVVIIHRGPSDA